jgi:hypothetical protein
MENDALLSVLDALIGMGAAVPTGEARKLYPEFPAQSLIDIPPSLTSA